MKNFPFKIACLGPAASFSHLAAKNYFGEAEYVFAAQVTAARAVRQQCADFAVLPVENNTAGFVNETLDALYWTSQIVIQDEIYCPIQQNLISSAQSISTIKEIHSHPQAFAQCRGNLEKLHAEVRDFVSCRCPQSRLTGCEINLPFGTGCAGGRATGWSSAAFHSHPDFQEHHSNCLRH